ncbi:hypothetical protein R5W23_004977 [Gemmata sp. JC673]|uniref:Non-specific serine/threonine protein kinase n=1 Tax=Gemmata algarum TaxID=2975278 RepID=A0ABU5EUH4_9BACT|nr:lipopolysaccharide kinase InaA family protein [Gemmata algarum]MDY3558282.1 hypothetical protein [Gemmata algarum]
MLADVLRKCGSLVAPAAGSSVRANGRVWRLSPEGVALFGAAGPALDEWLAGGSAAVVKHGPHRTVYRVDLASGTIYVKHCRINGPRAWAREVLRLPKAQLEFENAARLRALGIGAAAPLAWGTSDSRWPGQSYLVTRDLAPAVPLPDFLEAHPLTASQRQVLARDLGTFLAKLHENGVAHPDPHPGNLLVAWEGEDRSRAERGTVRNGFRFALLDVHAIRFGPPLPWAASRENLVLFNRWFQLRASRADRLRFWLSYRTARAGLVCPEGPKHLERATLASNRRFWVARTARYKGTHRTVRKVRAGHVRGLAVRDLPDEFLRTLLADPDAAFTRPGARLLKECAGSTVAELELPTPDGTRAVILKRVNTRDTFGALKNLFRASGVRRSWLLGHGLCERHLPTPRPLAVFHRYRAGFLPAEGYLLTAKVPDAVGLPEAVKACREAPVLRAWMDKLARVVRAMHDRGVSHRDLKAPNIMLAGAARDPATATPVLIDLVGVRAGTGAVPFARCAKELARLNASFLAVRHVTRTECLRFLRAYLGAGAGGRGWKTWWGAICRATRAKVAKNARRGRPIG